MVIPLQNPRAAWSAAIFCQRHAKGGALQSAEAIRSAGDCGNRPARRRSTGLHGRTLAEQQRQPAAFLRSQREAARRGQIGAPALFGEFPDHGSHTPRLERLFHRPERIARCHRTYHKQSCRIDAEEIAANAVYVARFERGKILLHHDNDTPPRPVEGRNSQRKTQRRAGVKKKNRRELVQFAQSKPALEDGVGRPE
jgi:hypothetical protein